MIMPDWSVTGCNPYKKDSFFISFDFYKAIQRFYRNRPLYSFGPGQSRILLSRKAASSLCIDFLLPTKASSFEDRLSN
jgi:hypothetical protein